MFGLFSKKWNPDGKVSERCACYAVQPVLVPRCLGVADRMVCSESLCQHIYITGGSSGLGLSLAHILVQKGANISIVARNQKKLDEALESLEVNKPAISSLLRIHIHSYIETTRIASSKILCILIRTRVRI
jgi:hypothetical protein